MNVVVIDDEALSRSRMRFLLADCAGLAIQLVGEAASASEALLLFEQLDVDVVLLDIHMPGMDGRVLASKLRQRSAAPAIIFVTAHAEHALQAFELDAVDYLTKPVRLSRLQSALQKAQRLLQQRLPEVGTQEAGYLTIQDRGRTERVPVGEVAYLKAELKYITVRTAERSLILDGALNELEDRYGALFLRVHRNALVARRLVRALEKVFDSDEGEGWAVRLVGIDELLPVSRRQLPALRELLAGAA